MSPYRLVDEETGETVRGDDGAPFEGMTAPAGALVEVYAGELEGTPTARISPGAATVPGLEPPDPNPEPIPPTEGNGMDVIENETQLRDALETYAREQRVGSCGSKTPITMTAPIVIQQTSHDGMPWGANLNFTRLLWRGPGDADMITYRGKDGISNRGLFLERFAMDGNGYGGTPARRCLHIYAPDGDPGSIYKFTPRDVFTAWAVNGIAIRGAVFEGYLENVHAENHQGDGIIMESLGLDGMSPWSIVSNIMVNHPNSSRNFGAGMRQPYSVNSILGSYVLNAEGGIASGEGIRAVMLSNGENTGEQLLSPTINGYSTVVAGNEASTDGKTHARRWDGSQWVSVGAPMLYGVNNVGHFDNANHMSYYGDGSVNVRWMR